MYMEIAVIRIDTLSPLRPLAAYWWIHFLDEPATQQLDKR